jgi:hypothetical protein
MTLEGSPSSGALRSSGDNLGIGGLNHPRPTLPPVGGPTKFLFLLPPVFRSIFV